MTRVIFLSTICALAIGVGPLGTSGYAAPVVVADYRFAAGNLSASSDTDPNTDASPISASGEVTLGLVTTGSTTLNTNMWSPSGPQFAHGLAAELARNEADTVAANNYLAFTVTPLASNELDFTSLQFWGRRNSNAVGDATFFLRSSLDDYAANLFATVPTAFSADNTSATFDLSTASTLQGIDQAVTFRLYVYTSGAGSSAVHAIAADDIRVSAEVVPEPAALSLLSVAGLALVRRRRRTLVV